MSKKTDLFQLLEDSVAGGATVVSTTAIVPDGIVVNLSKFGATIPVRTLGSYAAIQWGSAGSWQTIRVITQECEFLIDREFVGDGVNRFRFVRTNRELAAQSIVCWAEGFLNDA